MSLRDASYSACWCRPAPCLPHTTVIHGRRAHVSKCTPQRCIVISLWCTPAPYLPHTSFMHERCATASIFTTNRDSSCKIAFAVQTNVVLCFGLFCYLIVCCVSKCALGGDGETRNKGRRVVTFTLVHRLLCWTSMRIMPAATMHWWRSLATTSC